MFVVRGHPSLWKCNPGSCGHQYTVLSPTWCQREAHIGPIRINRQGGWLRQRLWRNWAITYSASLGWRLTYSYFVMVWILISAGTRMYFALLGLAVGSTVNLFFNMDGSNSFYPVARYKLYRKIRLHVCITFRHTNCISNIFFKETSFPITETS